MVIDEMGLGEGASRERVVEALGPSIRALRPEADRLQLRAVADLVIDGLLNLAGRGAAFVVPYTDFGGAQPTRRALSFHLLREVESSTGEVVLRATTEGINLYTGMLEFDVEDAQRAEEAVLASQIRRGKLEDAVRTARRARQRSIQYQEKLRGALKQARRDIRSVDWIAEVLATLNEAAEHLDERLRSERELLDKVRRKVDEAGEDARGWVELRDTLEDCVARHFRLQGEVQRANPEWLDAQERQAFRPRVLGPLPDLERGALLPSLTLPLATLEPLVEPLLRLFQPPAPPKLLYLPQLLGRLLAQRREREDAAAAPPAPELEAMNQDHRRFEEEERALVRALLARARAARLSELLDQLRAEGGEDAACRLLVLEVLAAWDPPEGTTLTVEDTGFLLVDAQFAGDDLMVNP